MLNQTGRLWGAAIHPACRDIARLTLAALAGAAAAACAPPDHVAERQLDLYAGDTAAGVAADTIGSLLSRLLHTLHTRDLERAAKLITSDFALVDYRPDSSGTPGPGARGESVNYYMVVQGRYTLDILTPDPVHERCEVPSAGGTVLLRVSDGSWVVSHWRRDPNEWRARQLLLVSGSPDGAPPVAGAVCRG